MKYRHFFKYACSLPPCAILMFLALFLSGCARENGALNLTYNHLANESPASFRVCHDYGCARQSRVSLSAAEWHSVTALFQPPAASAEAERRQIAKAIAAMEHLAGERSGTKGDKPGASLLKTESGQMDCVDETLNTARYLHFFEREALLRWHRVEQPVRRGYFIDGAWPHNSAVISDKQTGINYAVDSWFYQNGHEPAIIPVELWQNGWRPDKNKSP